MTLQHIVELLLAGLVVSTMFGGPCAALLGMWLIRKSKRQWTALPVRTPEGGAT